MSHHVTIKTQVRDLNALALAAMELGGELTLKTPTVTTYKTPYGEQPIPGDGIIRFTDLYYTVNVRKQADGTYALDGDEDIFHSRLPNGETMGQGYGKLVQLYGVHMAMVQARKLGHRVSRVAGKNGAINVVITGARL